MNDSHKVPEPSDELLELALSTRKASISLGQSGNTTRQEALKAIADSLRDKAKEIIDANQQDVKSSLEAGLSQSLLSRLKLTDRKLEAAIEGVRKVSLLPDPVGICQLKRELYKDLCLERRTVPLGVLGVIFEARPDAMIQIASLAIRSGNSAILKGGSEAKRTNQAIMTAIQYGLNNSSVSSKSICLLTTRDESMALLRMEGLVDLIIPRGSNELVKFIQDNTRIPVLGHADGICHLYVDSSADLTKALKIAVDSKCQYPAACNTIETLLVHKDIAPSFLAEAIPAFNKSEVKLLGDKMACSFGVLEEAHRSDWSTEYLDLVLSIKVVETIDDAIQHINRYGSRHTESIVAEDKNAADKFLHSVDSSGVYHNCSTRFADGFRYGFGAEVGISTQTLPPRGPVGLEGLVTYRYYLRGDGHIAGDFASGSKEFIHRDLQL
ncbi:glutamate-5-semialdehyde dehydrogenase [Prochlorococcus sp. MIT 0601]|uniref:glutamate-5-semialdehyde dehydrogenase n=1 Tax=Prochlorococcus sp. MIT 0601 TaxID=1499498 RepID=UPI000533AE29|nr:glutamate-5-semialdehyde dehydrogenase [Prochlorococcus sp. MIT 0601]KGG12286.1 Gamma-glutamyl phosphate reductase [Prochlorococcus sp. MIT 0601]